MKPPPGARRDPKTARFARRFDPLALIAVARAVAVAACTATSKPLMALTQSDYDAARASADHAYSPRAFRVAAQLGVSWSKLRMLLELEGESFTQTLNATMRAEARELTAQAAGQALRAVALRLDAITLRPQDYEAERERMLRADRDRWLHGGCLDDLLPTAGQIEVQVGWDEALAVAGLQPRPAPPTPENAPPRDSWTLSRCVASLIVALDELDRTMPGTHLTQRAYRRVNKRLPELAPASAITRCARNHATTFSRLRDELVAWRASGAAGEPEVLVEARKIDDLPPDEKPATKHRRARAAARRQERLDRDLRETAWASELLAVLGDEPVPMKHVLERLGWKRDTTVKRMRTLEDAGLVERVNHGTSRRTVLWQLAPAR